MLISLPGASTVRNPKGLHAHDQLYRHCSVHGLNRHLQMLAAISAPRYEQNTHIARLEQPRLQEALQAASILVRPAAGRSRADVMHLDFAQATNAEEFIRTQGIDQSSGSHGREMFADDLLPIGDLHRGHLGDHNRK